MAGNVRYQIFVSSTYSDLYAARRKVTEHILSMNHIPAGMEMFSANGRQQWATIQKTIDTSDYYVLIVGDRYGSISEDEGISYTEKEFDYASSKGIPTLCFLPGQKFSSSKDERESEPDRIKALEEFKDKIMKGQLCSLWNDENELIAQVSAALYKIFTDEPGIGWIRGDAADPDALTKLVKAMEDNNRLRLKVSELEKDKERDKPILSLKMNDISVSQKVFRFVLQEPDEIIEFKPFINKDTLPYGYRGLSQDVIDEYNNKLPTQEQVDTYNNRLRLYLTAKESKISISINNSGFVKANNASIRIHFPNGLKVINESDVKLIEPKEIKFPVLPSGLSGLDRILNTEYNSIIGNSLLGGNFHRNDLSILNDLGHIHDDLTIDDENIIYGKINSVRQGTNENLEPIFHLLSEHPGSFTVKVEILCDEYREWEKSEFTIIFE